MSFVWQTTPEEAFGQLFDSYAAAIHQLVFAVCQRRAPEIENWMKANAPWQDQTGNARQTLWAEAMQTVGEVILALDHGMAYGYWLEVKNAGRYAIIAPAVDHWLPIIMQDIQEQLRP